MPEPTPRVFISYRRGDTAFETTAIHRELTAHFGADHVFMDVDTIPGGHDFRRVMREAAGQCDVMLAVIGPKWSGAVDDSGRRRLDQSGDYVRVELEEAFQRSVLVIPLLVGDTPLPVSEELPPSIAELAFRHALTIRAGRDFDNDLRRLVADIRRSVKPPPTVPQRPAGGQQIVSDNQGQISLEVPPRPDQPARAGLLSRPSWPRQRLAAGIAAVCLFGVAAYFAVQWYFYRDADPCSPANQLLLSVPDEKLVGFNPQDSFPETADTPQVGPEPKDHHCKVQFSNWTGRPVRVWSYSPGMGGEQRHRQESGNTDQNRSKTSDAAWKSTIVCGASTEKLLAVPGWSYFLVEDLERSLSVARQENSGINDWFTPVDAGWRYLPYASDSIIRIQETFFEDPSGFAVVAQAQAATIKFKNGTSGTVTVRVYCRDTGLWENERPLVVPARASATIALRKGKFQIVARNEAGQEDRSERVLAAGEQDSMDFRAVYQ